MTVLDVPRPAPARPPGPPSSPGSAGARIGGLDGLRAVAVVAVVAFHLWPDVVPGGYLGVDLFMVLSGYLITGILLDERTRTGGLRLGRFWARRFRRLVPALVALLAGVAAWVQLGGWRELAPTVRGQGLAALGYAANWKLVADGVSYASLQDPPSPLLHLWSLAVEEQFYVVWPPLVALLLVRRGGPRAVAALAALAALASVVAMAAWYAPGVDPLRLYYGTDTRAHTFLVGAVTAVLVRRHPAVVAGQAVRRAGLVALGTLGLAFVLGEEGAWSYRGGFVAFAVVAAAAVVAATVPGPVRAALDRPVLRLLGRTSYGIYLWHWPVIVLVREEEVGFGGPGLLALRIGLIGLATTASWQLVERPAARCGRRGIVAMGTGGVAIAAVALLALPSTSLIPYADVDVDTLPPASVVPVEPTSPTSPTSPAGPAGPTAPPAVAPPATVLVVGDSGTYDAVPALAAAFGSVGTEVVNLAYPGVGVTRPDGVRDRWADAVATHDPDLVVVQLGGWDSGFLAEHGDAAYRAELDGAVATLTAGGAHVLWLAPLPGGEPIDGDPDRLYAELPSRFPGVVEHADLGAALAAPDGSFPREVDGRLLRKPDGWHLCPAGAEAVAAAVLEHLGIAASGWEAGAWRDDRRYDDPPGGCAS